MKKLTKLTQINNAFVIFTLLFCTLSGAQIKQPFSARFNQTVKGNVSIIANNMLSRTATDNYNGTADNHDFTNNVYVDIDNDDTTFNSSSADFINPEPSLECLSIRKAYLYWAASDKELNSGEDNQPDWNFNDVKLMLPGQSSYITLTANYADGEVIYRGRDEVAHFDNDPYVCVKDITTLVSGLSNPFGKYQVANVEAKEGSLTSHTNGNTGTAGGWQIVFVYESPNLPQKNVTLFDGYAHVNRVSNNFNVDFNGFQTISTGNVNADIVIGALEGDRSLSGDQLQIRNTSGNFVNISTPLRLANNFFNSRITVGNSDFINRAPASTNTLGFDAAVFNLNNPGNSIIGNNQSSATIRMTSNQETYGLFLLGLAIDVYAPNFDPILLQATSGSNPANPGDTMGFSFNIQNNGNDNAANVSVSTTLPPQVEFVSATGLPAGVTHTYNPATGNLTFNFVNGITDIGDPTLNINFQLAIKDECYFLEENCNLSFDLQFVASYNGVQNPSSLSTLSSSDLLECNMGDQLPMTININQPDAAIWATAPNGLDRTVECNDTDALAEAQSLFPVTDKCEFNLVKTSGNFVADGECGNTGTYTNTWAFTDACGRTISEFVQVITVTSSGGLAFVGQLPQDETVECDQVPTAPTLTATNACGTAEVTYDETRTDGACSATYTLTRTWTASDGCGNTIEHIQTINVQDTTAPTFDGELPQNITVECDNIPDPAILTATDNCGSIYMEYKDVVYEGSCASTYTIIRSWAATDECGNFVIHEQTLTVQDTTPPVLETPASDITVACGDAGNSIDQWLQNNGNASASDSCGTVTWSNNYNGAAANCAEPVEVTFTATDECGNSVSTTATYSIQDSVPPVIAGGSDMALECDGQDIDQAISQWLASNAGATATDDCSSVTWSNDFEALSQGCSANTGSATVTFTATDACGNSATVTATFTVLDTTAPTFDGNELPQDLTVECGAIPAAAELTATDSCGQANVSFEETTTDGSCPSSYTVTRTWTATDACGNSAQHVQTITVQDTTPPVLETPASDITVACGDAGNSIDQWLQNNGNASASDSCGTVTWCNNYNGAAANCAEPVEVTFTATDECGNSVSTTATYSIQDSVPPVIAGGSDMALECDGQDIDQAISQWLASNAGATATDDCSSVTWSNDFEALSQGCSANTGSATVTFTATDACGNSATVTATFTVLDTTAPTFDGNELPQDLTVECGAIPAAAELTATDSCGQANVSFEETTTDGSCPSSYTVTRTWTATDACGNSAQHVQTISVQDTTPPVLETPASDITVACGDAGNSIDQWLQNNGNASASDSCGTVTWSNNYNGAAANCAEPVEVTFTATDDCGNSVSTTATYSIQDSVPPVIAGGNDMALECDGQDIDQAISQWLASNAGATATDDCSSVTWSNDFEALSQGCSANTGSATVTFTATDACGNSATVTATFTVLDTTAPTFDGNELPQDLTVECGAIPAAAELTATDSCGQANVSFEETTTDGSCPSSYTVTRTWTATDACGNSAQHVQTISVQDTTPPTFDGNELPQDLTVECGAIPAAAELTATDSCGQANVSFEETTTDGSCPSSYTVTRTWTATDACGNSAQHVQTISVQDTTPPVLETPASDITVACGDAGNSIDQWLQNNGNASASDSCGTVTWSNNYNGAAANCAEPVEVTFTATDECGNSVSTTATYSIQDSVPPVIAGGSDMALECDGQDIDQAISQWLASNAGATATDDCSSVTWSNDFEALSQGCSANTGSATVTFTATDACGNSATVTATFTVLDTTAPTFDGNELPQDLTVECGAIPAAAELTATDSCGQANVSFEETTTDGSCPSSYTVTRTWTATDACGNSAQHVQTITVQDTTPPTFDGNELPQDLTVECGAIPAAAELTATDSCGQANVSFEETTTDGSCPSSYTVTRTWTATDACGNSAQHVQTISVQDTTPPTFDGNELPQDLTVECDNVPLASELTAQDSCGNANVTFNEVITPGACSGDYIITREWTASDECGNSTQHIQIITVQDTVAPVIVGEFDEIINVNCNNIPNTPDLVFQDACSENMSVSGPEETIVGDINSNYQIIRTWIVSDDCGNETTYTQTINVTVQSATLTFTADTLCIEDAPIDLFDVIGSNVDASGTWVVTSGNATLDDSIFNPATVSEMGEYVFTYTVAPEGECPMEYEVTVMVNDDCVVLPCGEDDVVISTTVTPNGDSINEFFTITGVEECGFTIELQIFNRWGAKIYENNNYQNDWNGYSSKASIGSSDKVPTGTYYYIINLKNSGLKPFAGPIYVATK